MGFLDFLNPLIYMRRKGTGDDPYVSRTEDYTIINNKVLLNEIPSQIYHVQITEPSTGKIFYESFENKVDATHYIVDYTHGTIQFAGTENGKIVRCIYRGTGQTFLPANRVYTKIEDGSVIETLQTIIDAGITATTAANINIADTGSHYTSEKVEGALQEIGSALADIAQYIVNVKSPPNGLAKAKGDGVTDDTAAINAIVQYVKTNKLGGIYIPNSNGSYMVNGNDLTDPIYYNNNGGIVVDFPCKIVMHPNATLQCITSNKNGYRVLNIKNATDVYICGGKIIGERLTHVGTVGEHGMGISISTCTNVHVDNTIISNCWGDGICVSGRDGYDTEYSEDIYITNVICKNNRRQGISIVSAKNVHIKGCTLRDTNGTAPESGIDIESNPGYPANENIFISDCVFKNNNTYDVIVTTSSKNVEITNNTMEKSLSGAVLVVNGATTDGVLIAHNIINGGGITSNGVVCSSSCVIDSNIIKNINSGADSSGIYIGGDGVIINNNDISSCSQGIRSEDVAVTNAQITNNKIHGITNNGLYTHKSVEYSSITNNIFFNIGVHAINGFDYLRNSLIANNNFRDIQKSAINGDVSNCTITNNSVIDAGKVDYASAWASINISSTVGSNFVFGNRVRNSIVGHVGIRNNVIPVTPNIISKNDLRYAVTGSVLSLHASDVNDGNFTL